MTLILAACETFTTISKSKAQNNVKTKAKAGKFIQLTD